MSFGLCHGLSKIGCQPVRGWTDDNDTACRLSQVTLIFDIGMTIAFLTVGALALKGRIALPTNAARAFIGLGCLPTLFFVLAVLEHDGYCCKTIPDPCPCGLWCYGKLNF